MDTAIQRHVAPGIPPVPHRATVGRERAFPTLRAVSEYEAGYRSYAGFPGATNAEVGTPEWMGWADRRDEAEGFAAMDDCAAWAVAHPATIGLHL